VTKPSTHLQVGELVALVGPETTIQLSFHFGGRRVPTARRCLSWLRRAAILQDRLHGHTAESLAAKYNVSRSCVTRILRRCDREKIRKTLETEWAHR
jgi:Mor family transcriptional regulator